MRKRQHGRRDATIEEKRVYLHVAIDELRRPWGMMQRGVDTGALRKISRDLREEDAFMDVLTDADTVEELAPWYIPSLMRLMHQRVDRADRTQIDFYVGDWFRMTY